MSIASRPRPAFAFAFVVFATPAAAASFTMDQVKSYPFPTQLTAAATGSRIAWALDEKGLRNVWTAEGPDAARRLTSYLVDDGQEITSLEVSADGRTRTSWVVPRPPASPSPPPPQHAPPGGRSRPPLFGPGDSTRMASW